MPTKQCPNPAVFRFVWASGDEGLICQAHSLKLRGVARACGLHVQLLPLDDDQPGEAPRCGQQIS